MSVNQLIDQSTAVSYRGENSKKPFHDHCPLCIHSLVQEKNPVVIFLDMDGVLIVDRHSSPTLDQIRLTIKKLFPNSDYPTDYHWNAAKARHLYPAAVDNFHTLLDGINQSHFHPLVVLSTAWRNDATLAQHKVAFKHYKFGEYLCGKTAPETIEDSYTPECKQGFDFTKSAFKTFGLKLESRADVIEFWLLDHGFHPKNSNFIVIDDCSFQGLSRFGMRFIHTKFSFTADKVNEALDVIHQYK